MTLLSSTSHTTIVNKRQREERSGAEATKLTLTEIEVASNGSSVTPVGKKKENKWDS